MDENYSVLIAQIMSDQMTSDNVYSGCTDYWGYFSDQQEYGSRALLFTNENFIFPKIGGYFVW